MTFALLAVAIWVVLWTELCHPVGAETETIVKVAPAAFGAVVVAYYQIHSPLVPEDWSAFALIGLVLLTISCAKIGFALRRALPPRTHRLGPIERNHPALRVVLAAVMAVVSLLAGLSAVRSARKSLPEAFLDQLEVRPAYGPVPGPEPIFPQNTSWKAEGPYLTSPGSLRGSRTPDAFSSECAIALVAKETDAAFQKLVVPTTLENYITPACCQSILYWNAKSELLIESEQSCRLLHLFEVRAWQGPSFRPAYPSVAAHAATFAPPISWTLSAFLAVIAVARELHRQRVARFGRLVLLLLGGAAPLLVAAFAGLVVGS